MVTYEKNYLTQVIFRLDFTTISDYEDKLKEFQKSIRKEFPIIQEAEGIEIETIEGAKAKKINKLTFFNKTKKRILSFETKNITIEFKEYSNFKEFQEII